MAGSLKKGSSASPKRTRKGSGKASAPEAGSAPFNNEDYNIRSPERTGLRVRSGKDKTSEPETGSAHFNSEDYNIRSPERTELLIKIKGVTENVPVSPALWACFQLGDMNRLQAFANSYEAMILVYQNPLGLIPLQCELLGF
jgi:hypothetical protein